MTANAARRLAPHPVIDRSTVEQTILDGLLYLEREALEADLADLARIIRSAAETYRNAQSEECDA